MLALLRHCILALNTAPHQLQSVLQELEAIGADELLGQVTQDLRHSISSLSVPEHMSQHKDHAHKKLRHCLQQKSTNLAVRIALRLTEYTDLVKKKNTVHVQTLIETDLSESDVRTGLRALSAEGLLNWDGEDTILLTPEQVKRLARYYKCE